MPIDRRIEAIQWLIVAAMFAPTVWAWSLVPEQLAVHWNLAGRPGRYCGRYRDATTLTIRPPASTVTRTTWRMAGPVPGAGAGWRKVKITFSPARSIVGRTPSSAANA